MLNKVVFAAATAAAVFGFANEARAEGYVESAANTRYGQCTATTQGVGGSATVAWYDTGKPIKVGDAIYVRAVAVNGCLTSGMIVAFRLPFNTFLVEDPINAPVSCWRTPSGGTRTQIVDPQQCFTRSKAGALGAHFAEVYMAPFEALEVYVPVRFAQTFNGTIGVIARNGIGDMTPSTPFNVGARAAEFFNTTAVPDSSGFGATATFTLRNFFQGGKVSVEYGETTSFGQYIEQDVEAGISEQSNRSIVLVNLTPARTYYYRPRMITSAGETYVGPVQQFATPPATIVWPPPTTVPCPRYPCVRR